MFYLFIIAFENPVDSTRHWWRKALYKAFVFWLDAWGELLAFIHGQDHKLALNYAYYEEP